MGTKKYPYDDEFQDRIVALCLREKQFLHQHAAVIKPDYFNNYECAELIRLVLDYYFEKYKVPSEDRLHALVVDTFRSDKKTRNAMLRLLDSVFTADLSDIDQVSEVVVEFGRSREMEALVGQVTDKILHGERVDVMWELVDRARVSSSASQHEEMDLSANFLDAPAIVSKSGLYNSSLKIPTMIGGLDTQLNGGLGRGELGMVVADTGRGKSTFLVNMGAAALIQGYSVYHLLITELVNIDMLLRYSARLTGHACQDIANQVSVSEYESKMRKVMEQYRPKIKSRRVPPGTTVSAVRSLISRYRYRHGSAPSLLLLDNTDDLVSRHKSSDTYDELGHVYSELKDLAYDFDMAIWCDSQTNRAASSTGSIKLQHVGDSYKKPRRADVVLSLNQTDEEVEIEHCRLRPIKVRRGGRGKDEIHCKLQASRMLMFETDPPVEEELPERKSKRRIAEGGSRRAEKRDDDRDDRDDRRDRDEKKQRRAERGRDDRDDDRKEARRREREDSRRSRDERREDEAA